MVNKEIKLTKKEAVCIRKLIINDSILDEAFDKLLNKQAENLSKKDDWWQKLDNKHKLDLKNNIYKVSVRERLIKYDRPNKAPRTYS